ncbi:MAG: type I methionyl aminopeptidase [Planctomycetota bacterium]
MPPIPKLSPAEGDAAYAAAQKVVDVHRALADMLEPGLTTAQIDTFVGKTLDDLGSKSCFKGYKPGGMPPFPSHACLSVNDCIVHGTAATHEAPLGPGDVLKIDIGVLFRGWVGDAAWTYVFGEPSAEVKKLCDAGKESLREGIEELAPGKTYAHWAERVQGIVERERGLHLVRGLGGHGYGRKLHAPPFVSNVPATYPGEWPDGARACEPGVLVAVEPMIAVGTPKTTQAQRSWPIYTADGSMSVHYEHDVLITENGPRVLTEGLEEVRDVIPC